MGNLLGPSLTFQVEFLEYQTSRFAYSFRLARLPLPATTIGCYEPSDVVAGPFIRKHCGEIDGIDGIFEGPNQ